MAACWAAKLAAIIEGAVKRKRKKVSISTLRFLARSSQATQPTNRTPAPIERRNPRRNRTPPRTRRRPPRRIHLQPLRGLGILDRINLSQHKQPQRHVKQEDQTKADGFGPDQGAQVPGKEEGDVEWRRVDDKDGETKAGKAEDKVPLVGDHVFSKGKLDAGCGVRFDSVNKAQQLHPCNDRQTPTFDEEQVPALEEKDTKEVSRLALALGIKLLRRGLKIPSTKRKS